MNLKPRPMSEAPLNDEILLVRDDGTYAAICTGDYPRFPPHWIGFYLIADLLRAAEIVDKITPEGYEYYVEDKTIRFRKLPPLVRYRWEAEEGVRKIQIGDWWWDQYHQNWKLAESDKNGVGLCARRVEVKA